TADVTGIACSHLHMIGYFGQTLNRFLACTFVEAAVLGEVVEVSAVASLQVGHVISFKNDDLIPIVLSCQSDFDCEFIL
ncbi:hypothetical protein, partial [Xanthomonas hortorum]